MGIYDRDYNRDNYYGGGGGCGRRISMPPMTPVVKWLLIINFAVFALSLIPQVGDMLFSLFAVSTASIFQSLQAWRLITYQFLHSTTDFWHIIFNMLMLFFFGPLLERTWGSKKFLIFYLICGAMGGIAYPLLYHLGFFGQLPLPLVGASGSLYGIIAACAIMFPRVKVYVYGIFPIPLLVLGGIMVLISAVGLFSGNNQGGEAAHLSGLFAGAAYVLWQPWLQKTRTNINKGRWEKKIQQERDLFVSVDQILDKVHKSGMKSLTRKEKQILKQATEKEQSK